MVVVVDGRLGVGLGACNRLAQIWSNTVIMAASFARSGKKASRRYPPRLQTAHLSPIQR
jgi:hypothetical protein